MSLTMLDGIVYHMNEFFKKCEQCHLLHRDLKPDNIMLLADDSLKVSQLYILDLIYLYMYIVVCIYTYPGSTLCIIYHSRFEYFVRFISSLLASTRPSISRGLQSPPNRLLIYQCMHQVIDYAYAKLHAVSTLPLEEQFVTNGGHTPSFMAPEVSPTFSTTVLESHYHTSLPQCLILLERIQQPVE
jgi:serine/threonine protein kinase